jgi:hypothetical protein
MEVCGLVGDPAQKPGHGGMRSQRLHVAAANQFGIAQVRMDRPVTDRVQRHDGAPSPAFGNWMMPFDAPSQRPQAKPAHSLPDKTGTRRTAKVVSQVIASELGTYQILNLIVQTRKLAAVLAWKDAR